MYNGRMIELARDTRGMTQSELADKLVTIPQSLLSLYENSKIDIPESAILKISQTVNFPISFFKKQKSVSRISKFYYRKRSAFPAKEIGPLESKIDVMRMVYQEFLKSIKFDIPELPKIPVTNKTSPAQIAALIRTFFNLNDGPIDEPIQLIESVGIPVLLLDVSSDKFSGMTVQTSSNYPMILINKNLPNDHQKFTLFHELGHIIMHIPFSEEADFYDRVMEDINIIENEADLFAGAFLVPEMGAKKTFRPFTYSRLADLKMYWKVSKQMLIMQAKNTGIIDKAKCTNLFIELSRYGERKKEKIDIPIDKPAMFKKIVDLHEEKLGYSREEVSLNIAAMHLNDFNDWFNLNPPATLRLVPND